MLEKLSHLKFTFCEGATTIDVVPWHDKGGKRLETESIISDGYVQRSSQGELDLDVDQTSKMI